MSSFGLYATDSVIKPFQRMLNELLQLNLKVDGNIGNVTLSAIYAYQKLKGITELDKNGACYGPLTQAAAKSFIEKKYIKPSDFVEAGISLGVETELVRAFSLTESKEFGFLDNGFPVILFERHIFYRSLSIKLGVSKADKYVAISPNVCNPNRGGYLGGQKEVDRLNKAAEIDSELAHAAASWGLFQIMGNNYNSVGFNSVQAFVDSVKLSEANQLKAFVGFIKGKPVLYKATKEKDFANMALYYNGSAYRDHTPPYDVQLRNNYLNEMNKK